MTQEKFNPIYNKLNELNELQMYLADKVVWENQEGQPDHFDNLPKVEQIALIDIFNKVKQTVNSIEQFDHWFMGKK